MNNNRKARAIISKNTGKQTERRQKDKDNNKKPIVQRFQASVPSSVNACEAKRLDRSDVVE
jgi:hypothetical protein